MLDNDERSRNDSYLLSDKSKLTLSYGMKQGDVARTAITATRHMKEVSCKDEMIEYRQGRKR